MVSDSKTERFFRAQGLSKKYIEHIFCSSISDMFIQYNMLYYKVIF